ncbi:MAG: hypothetical protein KAY50_07000 [Chitinophagaceae bacterium]|nr:hypothetical protein [Chitinophagaceae bacterium]
MKPIYYFIIVGIFLLILVIKAIFKRASIFIKAILGHVFSDFDDLETFKKWDKELDIGHKMNLLYTAIFIVVGISFFVYAYFFKPFS